MSKRAFRKILIKKHYHDFNGPELGVFAGGVLLKFTAYPLVPTPIVPLLTLGSQITALTGIISLRITDKSPTLEQDEITAMTVLVDSLDALADQLEYLANQATPGDETATTSAIIFVGYQVQETHGKQEQTFEVIDTEHASATLTNAIPEDPKPARIFAWSFTNTPLDDTSWSAPIFTTESKVTLTGLPSDKRAFFRGAVMIMQGRNPSYDVNVAQLVWQVDIISALIP